MQYYVTLCVHRNYITTEVREQYTPNDYREHCISSPSAAHLIYDVSGNYLDEPHHEYNATFPSFPYPAYLRIATKVFDDTRDIGVVEAVFSDNERGILHFEGAFTSAPQDLRVKILKNIVACVQNRDAGTLIQLVKELSKFKI